MAEQRPDVQTGESAAGAVEPTGITARDERATSERASDEAQGAAASAKDKAQDAAASAKDKAQDAAASAKDKAQDAAASAKDKTQDVAASATEKAGEHPAATAAVGAAAGLAAGRAIKAARSDSSGADDAPQAPQEYAPATSQGSGNAESAQEKMRDGIGDAASKIGDKTPSKEDVKEKAGGLADKAREHPEAVVGGAAVAGLAAGLALPETQIEREKLAPHAKEARDELTGRVQGTVQQVKSALQDAAGDVAGSVKEQGRQRDDKVGEMAEKAADTTHEKVTPRNP